MSKSDTKSPRARTEAYDRNDPTLLVNVLGDTDVEKSRPVPDLKNLKVGDVLACGESPPRLVAVREITKQYVVTGDRWGRSSKWSVSDLGHYPKSSRGDVWHTTYLRRATENDRHAIAVYNARANLDQFMRDAVDNAVITLARFIPPDYVRKTK